MANHMANLALKEVHAFIDKLRTTEAVHGHPSYDFFFIKLLSYSKHIFIVSGCRKSGMMTVSIIVGIIKLALNFNIFFKCTVRAFRGRAKFFDLIVTF